MEDCEHGAFQNKRAIPYLIGVFCVMTTLKAELCVNLINRINLTAEFDMNPDRYVLQEFVSIDKPN